MVGTMRKLIFLSVSLAVLLLYGCGLVAPEAAARRKASGHVQPVLTALENYHRDHKAYPTNLAQLSPDYLKGDVKKFLEGHSDVGIVWSLQYERVNPSDYELWFRGAHHDAKYQNGKFVSGGTSYFR